MNTSRRSFFGLLGASGAGVAAAAIPTAEIAPVPPPVKATPPTGRSPLTDIGEDMLSRLVKRLPVKVIHTGRELDGGEYNVETRVYLHRNNAGFSFPGRYGERDQRYVSDCLDSVATYFADVASSVLAKGDGRTLLTADLICPYGVGAIRVVDGDLSVRAIREYEFNRDTAHCRFDMILGTVLSEADQHCLSSDASYFMCLGPDWKPGQGW